MLIKDVNFFARYNEAQRREKTVSKQTVMQTSVVSGIVIVTIVGASVLQVMNTGIQSQIDTINAYINSPEVLAQSTEVAEKQKILDNVTGYYNAIETANYKLSTIIKPDKDLIASITSLLPGGTVITNFSISGGNVSLSCRSDQEAKLAQFVHALRSVETIFSVNYAGYTKAENSYTTSIQIVLNPGGIQDATNE